MIEIETKDLERLFELAFEGATSEYSQNHDYEDCLLLRQKYFGEEIWYRVYPKRFFKTREEAEANERQTPGKRCGITHRIIPMDKYDKEMEIENFRVYGWNRKYCRKCGYIDLEGSVYCMRCRIRINKHIKMEHVLIPKND